nr:capsule assembly Wzi family protein [uncultured Carboxylicivirga sp.]
MMQYKYTIILMSLILLSSSILAQDKYNLKLETSVSVANDGIMPLWLHANEWGRYNQDGNLNGMFYVQGNYKLLGDDLFSLDVGTGFVLNTDFKTSFLHEAYLKGHFWIIDYTIGKEANSWVAYNDRLSSGHFLMSNNARPIPKVTLGFEDYRKVGFLRNWLEIKGGITQGVLNDDRGEHSRSASNILLHEKWLYGRMGNLKIKPYLGIVHSAFMGGTRPDGKKIPVDFWPTFFAKGSAKLGGGEETNAAGAHMGLWDFGLYFESDKYDIQFYYQKPFADASGLKLWNGHNKDIITGVLINPKEISWLKGISIEFLKTDVQSDYGIPDPLYPVNYNGHKKGSIIWKEDIEADFDDFMYQVFGEERVGWNWEQVNRYLEVELNEGYKYGGRDDYMNNGTYYNGWTYHGASMGTPLYHTIDAVEKYYGGSLNKNNYFINNRVNGFHLGVEGKVTKDIDFRIKSTYTKNFGSFDEEFIGRYSWERVEYNFYEGGKTQVYTMLEGSWSMPNIKALQLNGTLAYDFGQLYHSFGGRLGIVYRPSF